MCVDLVGTSKIRAHGMTGYHFSPDLDLESLNSLGSYVSPAHLLGFRHCSCLGIAPRAQLLKKSAWLLHNFCDEAPPTSHASNKVARACGRHCYCHAENSELILVGRIVHECCPVSATEVSLHN